jgi:hypothetical protein
MSSWRGCSHPGPIEHRLRELGDVEALVVGTFAEHSADVHTLVDGLAEEV